MATAVKKMISLPPELAREASASADPLGRKGTGLQ
jgi:hypothetical protein